MPVCIMGMCVVDKGRVQAERSKVKTIKNCSVPKMNKAVYRSPGYHRQIHPLKLAIRLN